MLDMSKPLQIRIRNSTYPLTPEGHFSGSMRHIVLENIPEPIKKTMIACLYRWGQDECVINFLNIGAMDAFFRNQPGKVLGYKWITVSEGDFEADNS